MKTAVISFSRRGSILGQKICRGLRARQHEATGYCKSKYRKEGSDAAPVGASLGEWTKERFADSEAIVFVGACGIAVRSIAPFVKSKKTDPAVVVVDEQGKFAISLLSGHLGGANELAEEIAALCGAQPVVTTATDLNKKFAVDVFADKNGCQISDMVLAKEVSAALLAGKEVGFASDFPWTGELPAGLKAVKDGEEKPELGIYVTSGCGTKPFARTLFLIAPTVTVGIGCRKGTPKEAVSRMVERVCRECGISLSALEQAASIDLKKEEPGILAFCEELDLPFVTYSAELLKQAEGAFSSSSFVAEVTGVDNVCERAAIIGSSREGNGRLILRKQAQDKVTAALAVKEWRIRFE